MKILVTGAAGFIGSHLVDRYLEEGHDVVALDNLSRGKRENLNPRARFVELDVRDREGVDRLFRRERFDLVNHHAAQIDVRASVADPLFDAECNVSGTLNLLEACLRYGTEDFVFVSSGGVIYGEGEPEALPLPETAPKRPLSPYGVSKLAAEYYLFYYHTVHGLRYVALRYGNVYGPRQDPHGEAGVVAIFAGQLLRGQTPTIFGDGDQTRDYVFIEDVVEANRLATARLAELNRSPARALDDLAFNVGTGRETSVNALYEALAALTGHRGSARHGAPRPGELRRNALDVSKAKRLLGYRPRHTLEEGLAATLEWVRRPRPHPHRQARAAP